MLRAALALAAMSSAAAAQPCGRGKPAAIELAEVAADAHAFVFVGRVAAHHVAGSSIEDRVGTIEVEVRDVLRGSTKAKRIEVPAAAAKCIPKAACLPSVFDIAEVGATVLVGCVVPARGAPRTTIEAGDTAAIADLRRCLTFTGADRTAAVADAFVDGGPLARRCVARFVCDAARRADAVAALSRVTRAAKLDAEAKLDIALVLVEPVARAQSIIGCTTPPKLFQADRGGGDATNALVARTLVEGMVAETDDTLRRRWANQLWGMMVAWFDHPGERVRALRKLDAKLAARAIGVLRALAGADAPHYEELAKAIAAANP